MKMIVSLGNPGTKYEHTRHNAGFLALDWLLTTYNIQHTTWDKKYDSKILETKINKQKILFVKPVTYMNDSGKAVVEIINFYKVDVKNDLLIIHDDSDLPLGTIRLTDSSSSAGHNGVQDIIDKLGTQGFHRIRIGVESRDSRKDMPTEAFVLQNFTDNELAKLQADVFPKIKKEIEKFIGNT